MKPAATWKPMLRATPIRNADATATSGPDGVMTIKVENERPKYLIPPISWILPYKPYRTTRLDGIGSFLWELCGKDQPVEAIIDEFATKYSLTFHEARVSVTGYLKDLIQRGILAIALDEE